MIRVKFEFANVSLCTHFVNIHLSRIIVCLTIAVTDLHFPISHRLNNRDFSLASLVKRSVPQSFRKTCFLENLLMLSAIVQVPKSMVYVFMEENFATK